MFFFSFHRLFTLNILLFLHILFLFMSQDNLTYLLCGERGFCEAFNLVFLYGFKSTRLFGKNLFIWDFLGKVILKF